MRARECWVAESESGEPIQSALRQERLNNKNTVARYVPADECAWALEQLLDGDAEGAIKTLRRITGRQ